MKKTLLSLATVVALGFSASSQASVINVGGVSWDPDSLFDFTTTDQLYETVANTVGNVLNGYGRINTINGLTGFCSGCELTYIFSGYTLASTTGGKFTFTGGSINLYVDNTSNFNPAVQSSASNGTLWLSLAGRTHIDVATGNTGTLHSAPTPTVAGVKGDGGGFLDVVGGLAAGNFDTNTRAVVNADTSLGFADFQFTSSFQLLPTPFLSDDGRVYALFGSNDLQGNSIPEPGSLALLGLGLAGLAVARRRKSI